MHRFTVDYRKDERGQGTILNRGYFLNGLPRLIALCRLLGHKPVVDGYDSKYGKPGRWVCCKRCGIRPQPQGALDATEWDLGQPYTGPFNLSPPTPPDIIKRLEDATPVPQPTSEPGPWPASPTSGVGAQFIIGRSFSGVGFDIKVGSPASEQCLAAHISLNPLGALYVHTEDHGRWIQRLLNNTKWESRETGIRFDLGTFSWRLWAPRDHSSINDPGWMRGSIHIDPRHYLLGPNRGDYTTHGEKTQATVYMPDGTQYDITLVLERWERGRARGRKTITWEADWSCRGGIPVRFDRSIHGASVNVTEDAATSGQWIQQACAAIAAQCAEDRARYGYEPADA
ncbi:hypothetical protein AB0D56_30685 [Streptomyces sp. NPDC048209]|uniref:hypothetical protein n=1 Tax=Streptomyces sp. NPDC048209 TaxID=3156689 RepID=UPI00343B61DF